MKKQTVRKIFPALGTINSIEITLTEKDTISKKQLGELLNQAKEMVIDFDDRWSLYKPESEIRHLNKMAGLGPVPISSDTYALLEASREYARETQSCFDPTSGPLSLLWKNAIKAGRIPDPFSIIEARRLVSWEDLRLSGINISPKAELVQKGMQVDLGGIAKGYAADCTRALLQKAGIGKATINFGGTVISMGLPQQVGIRNPYADSLIGSVTVADKAVVTSGVYEQYRQIKGHLYHHMIDPFTGSPSQNGIFSATLIGSDATELDAIATAVCVMDPLQAAALLALRRIDAVLILSDGSVLMTPSLENFLPNQLKRS